MENTKNVTTKGLECVEEDVSKDNIESLLLTFKASFNQLIASNDLLLSNINSIEKSLHTNVFQISSSSISSKKKAKRKGRWSTDQEVDNIERTYTKTTSNFDDDDDDNKMITRSPDLETDWIQTMAEHRCASELFLNCAYKVYVKLLIANTLSNSSKRVGSSATCDDLSSSNYYHDICNEDQLDQDIK